MIALAMHGNIVAGRTHVILRKQLSTSRGRGGFLLFKLLSGVSNNLNGKSGKVEIKDILKAIDGRAIRSRGETRASTVDGGRANNGSKGLNRSKSVHQLTGGNGRGHFLNKTKRVSSLGLTYPPSKNFLQFFLIFF